MMISYFLASSDSSYFPSAFHPHLLPLRQSQACRSFVGLCSRVVVLSFRFEKRPN